MAVLGSDQVTVVDVTDAYSVVLTSESYTFPGTENAAKAGNTTTQIIAMRGAEQVNASVTLAEVAAPSGVTVTKDTDTTSPTLTIAVSTSVTSPGNVTIPVHIGDVTIEKTFSFAIAFTGPGGTAGKGIVGTPAVTYQEGSSGTTAPSGTWTSAIPSVDPGQYLWSKTVTNYTDGTSTTAYAVGRMGERGLPGKGISDTPVITYQVGTSSTTVPSGTWLTSVPSVPEGQYLWTRTVTSYTEGSPTTAYSTARHGADGAKGADAITVSVSSSNGFIFKNSAISTTFTAHVYKAGLEITGSALTALGTIKWYKDGETAAVGTGQTFTIDSGDVTGKAAFAAQLED